jgi:hypothetical protein
MFFNAKQYQTYLNGPDRSWSRAALRRETGQLEYNPSKYGWTNDGYAASHDGPITEEEAEQHLNEVKKALKQRGEGDAKVSCPGKWYRPWDVVPELAAWEAPVGDYGVGVEVEMGFVSLEASQEVAEHISDWDYIALDMEGGDWPIEATFPPVPFSTIKTSKVMEYTDYLNNNSHLVEYHDNGSMIGTHVNVSKGGQGIPVGRVQSLTYALQEVVRDYRLAEKYFGRHPYGYANGMDSHPSGGYRWIEFKLFNSQTDPSRLLQYINEAVCLTELVCDTSRAITAQEVHLALEKGYNMDCTVPANAEFSAYDYAIAA